MEAKFTKLYPNIIPPEVLNALMLILISVLVFWFITFILRCFHIFEGVWSYRSRESYLIKVDGIDEISSFWSVEPVREYLLSFLREKLDSPVLKIPNIKSPFNIHENSLKIDAKKMFGRDHSFGISFRFDSDNPCTVELFFHVKEIMFNENILEVCKNKLEAGEDLDFDVSAALKETGFCKKIIPKREYEPDEDIFFRIPEKHHFLLKDENPGEKGYVNEPSVFFKSLPKKVVTETKPKKKGQKPIARYTEEIILPLVILLTNIKGKQITETEETVVIPEKNEYDGEVQNVIIVAEFVDKKISIVKTLYHTKKGVFLSSPVFKEEGDECVICLSEDKEVIFIPCCHNCVCKKCLKHIQKCPICRNSIDGFVFQ